MRNSLNELNIFALRDLARRTGVVSPTSKKKDQLIREILEIMSGKKKPQETKTKQGRPPKMFGYNLANMFIGDEDGLMAPAQTLKQNLPRFEDQKMVTVAGWLELVNNNSAMLWVEKNLKMENYFVPSMVLSEYKVKMGDRIVAEVNADENNKIVKQIFSINDCPIMQLEEKREDYCEISHNIPTRKLEFSKEEFDLLDLRCGENIYVYGSNNNKNTIKIVDMLMSCKIENKIYINISLAEKNKIFLKGLQHTENFVADITDETGIARRAVALALERAKRILETGEDVLLVVDDVCSMVGIDKENLNLVKNLVSVAKEAETKGSITLLAIIPNAGFNQIEKLADVRLKIENEKISLIN